MAVNKKKCVIVFSGFNPRAVIAFLRTMESKGVEYFIIAKSDQDQILFTEYKHKVLAIRKSVSINLEDLLLSIKEVQKKHIADEYLIAPTAEALNRFLLCNRKYFEELGCIIPLVEKELYELISNKYSFGNICAENGILVPREIELNDIITFPIVAKPIKYSSTAEKDNLYPVLINEKTDLKMFLNHYNTKDFYYQEYIDGRSFYLLYYFHRNGEIYKFSQENLMQQPEGKSMLAAISSDFHNMDESHKYEKMFKSLKFYGFVMVEVKQNKDKNYMIEANPRFWGPSQLFVDAGMNLFEVFLHDYGLIEHLPQFKLAKNITKYLWFGGMKKYLSDFRQVVFYNYNLDLLIRQFPDLLKNDIYLRKDTYNIFANEVFGTKGVIHEFENNK